MKGGGTAQGVHVVINCKLQPADFHNLVIIIVGEEEV